MISKVSYKRERELQLERGYTVDDKSYHYVTSVMLNAITPEGIKRRNTNRDLSTQSQRAKDSKRDKMIRVKAIRVSDNTIIGVYESLMACQKATGVYNSRISNILNPKRADKTANGYRFKYA